MKTNEAVLPKQLIERVIDRLNAAQIFSLSVELRAALAATATVAKDGGASQIEDEEGISQALQMVIASRGSHGAMCSFYRLANIWGAKQRTGLEAAIARANSNESLVRAQERTIAIFAHTVERMHSTLSELSKCDGGANNVASAEVLAARVRSTASAAITPQPVTPKPEASAEQPAGEFDIKYMRATAKALRDEDNQTRSNYWALGHDAADFLDKLADRLAAPISEDTGNRAVESVMQAIKDAPRNIAARADMTPKGNMAPADSSSAAPTRKGMYD